MKKIMNKTAVVFSMVVVLLVLAACGNNQINVSSNEVKEEAVQNSTTEQQISFETSYPFNIADYTDTVITLNEEPKKIVTLVPSDAEIVFAIKGEEKLVGVNAYSDYPAEAQKIESVGDSAINVEAVVALEPDLVLGSSSMNGDYIEALRSLGITVYVGDPNTYDETMEHILVLGQLLNNQEEANSIVENMKQVKTEIVEKVANAEKTKVYVEFSPGWTVGHATFIDDLISIAGGENISAGEAGWYEVNSEAVIEANPDVIIYPNFGEPESSILKGINERAGWQVIDAMKNNRIVEVSNEPLVRVGPRLTIGLQEIAKAIHPELYN